MREWFATYVGLEAEATAISVYQAEIVPGLLQTPRYAAAAPAKQLLGISHLLHRAARAGSVLGRRTLVPGGRAIGKGPHFYVKRSSQAECSS